MEADGHYVVRFSGEGAGRHEQHRARLYEAVDFGGWIVVEAVVGLGLGFFLFAASAFGRLLG